MVSFAPRPLLPSGKQPPYILDMSLGGTQSQVWTTWRRENSWPYRVSKPDPSVVQPVASRCTDCAIPAPLQLSILTICYRSKENFIYSYFKLICWYLFCDTEENHRKITVASIVAESGTKHWGGRYAVSYCKKNMCFWTNRNPLTQVT
jgi:hypothetical protein